MTAANGFAVAALNLRSAQASIVVEAVAPAWTQEYEELSTGNTAGEADTRALTGVAGATTSCSWALGSASGGGWAAALVVFTASAPALIAVPDVVGDLQVDAVTAITAAGLTVGTVTTSLSDAVPAGHVVSQSPAAGTLVAPGSAVDLVLAVAPGLVVTIDGVPQRILHESLSIQATINGRDRLSATLPLPTVAPDVRQAIVVTFDGVRIFAGLIDTVTEQAATSKTDVPSQLYAITAADFNAIADWRYIDGISGPTETLKYALTALVAYMPGVTLNPAQVDGPVLPQRTYSLAKVSQVLDEFTTITGFVWNVDYAGVLTMWDPGVVSAPFDILDSNAYAIGEITVEPIATEYATTVLLLCGDSSQRAVADNFTGDGSTLEFPLHYPLVSHSGTLTVGGVTEAVGPGEAWELEEVPAPHRPTYNLVRAIGGAPGVGVAIVFPYTAQFPLLIRVDDAAAVALVGGYIERLIQEPGIFHYDQAVAVANGHLSQVATPRLEVRYSTITAGLAPGQTQTITIANRGLSGEFFLTDVETRMRDPLLLRQVTAQTAPPFQAIASWRETYKQWAQVTGSVSTGTTTGDVTVPPAPTVHGHTHEPGGMDPMTVDSTPSIGSLRTLGHRRESGRAGQRCALHRRAGRAPRDARTRRQ